MLNFKYLTCSYYHIISSKLIMVWLNFLFSVVKLGPGRENVGNPAPWVLYLPAWGEQSPLPAGPLYPGASVCSGDY